MDETTSNGWMSEIRTRAAPEPTRLRQALRPVLALCLLGILSLADAPKAIAQSRRDPKPSPTPDRTIEVVDAIAGSLREARLTLDAIRGDLSGLGSRLDLLATQIAEIKAIAEPMREEVRGLYVETSNVRSEIARLEQSNLAYTDSLGRSRYVLTLLLVATAVLQLIVLAVLMRSR